MRQRTSLACALVHRPRLLLLDEPTVGVDPQLRATFWSYFRHLAAGGTTLIISSHVMDEAERCDRLGFMRQGKLLAAGLGGRAARAGRDGHPGRGFPPLCRKEGVPMNVRRVLILARRVMRQILRDRRTVGLLIFAPMLVLTLGAILFRAEPAPIPLGVVNEDRGMTCRWPAR